MRFLAHLIWLNVISSLLSLKTQEGAVLLHRIAPLLLLLLLLLLSSCCIRARARARGADERNVRVTCSVLFDDLQYELMISIYTREYINYHQLRLPHGLAVAIIFVATNAGISAVGTSGRSGHV